MGLIVATGAGCADSAPVSSTVPDTRDLGPHTVPDPRYTTTGRVIRVDNGDTIVADIYGAAVTIRLIGVAAPDTARPGQGQCFGRQAAEFTASIATPGRVVRIEGDPALGAIDRRGRTLAYVWTDSPFSLNERLITTGNALQFDVDDVPYRQRARFQADEQRAQSERDGLWGLCGPH